MKPASLLSYAYFAHLSKPISDRVLYRAIRRHRVRTIVELGIGAGRRSRRLIATARRYQPHQRVAYTGVDLFEARSVPRLTLKQAYRTLASPQLRLWLVPGDPLTALARTANSLTGATDLLVIALDQDRQSLSQAWFYVPRMLHERSLVFVEEPAEGNEPTRFRLLARAELDLLAGGCNRARRRAA